MHKNISTDWSEIRFTDKNAAVIDTTPAPKSRRIVFIENGKIRSATVSGHFVVADVPDPVSSYSQKTRIEVECLWYGRKPPSSWMHMTISQGSCIDVPNYSGAVVTNIGR